jgi:hypothetical protein
VTLITPTRDFVDNFFTYLDTADPALLEELIEDSAPIGSDDIVNDGVINVINSIHATTQAFMNNAYVFGNASFAPIDNVGTRS